MLWYGYNIAENLNFEIGVFEKFKILTCSMVCLEFENMRPDSLTLVVAKLQEE